MDAGSGVDSGADVRAGSGWGLAGIFRGEHLNALEANEKPLPRCDLGAIEIFLGLFFSMDYLLRGVFGGLKPPAAATGLVPQMR